MTGHDPRIQGVAVALAALARSHHGDAVILKDLLDGWGLDLAALKAAGADTYDLAAIRKCLNCA